MAPVVDWGAAMGVANKVLVGWGEATAVASSAPSGRARRGSLVIVALLVGLDEASYAWRCLTFLHLVSFSWLYSPLLRLLSRWLALLRFA